MKIRWKSFQKLKLNWKSGNFVWTKNILNIYFIFYFFDKEHLFFRDTKSPSVAKHLFEHSKIILRVTRWLVGATEQRNNSCQFPWKTERTITTWLSWVELSRVSFWALKQNPTNLRISYSHSSNWFQWLKTLPKRCRLAHNPLLLLLLLLRNRPKIHPR